MSEIPDFYKKLLVSPGAATLSVISKDGSIQSTLVWFDYDGEFIKLNMTQGAPGVDHHLLCSVHHINRGIIAAEKGQVF
jgi:hypothetical protein